MNKTKAKASALDLVLAGAFFFLAGMLITYIGLNYAPTLLIIYWAVVFLIAALASPPARRLYAKVIRM